MAKEYEKEKTAKMRENERFDAGKLKKSKIFSKRY